MRVYLHCCPDEGIDEFARVRADNHTSSALGVPMAELMRRVEATRRLREHTIRREKERLAPLLKMFNLQTTVCGWTNTPQLHSPTCCLMNVPTEGVWPLRAWDPYVFHQEPPPRPVSDDNRADKGDLAANPATSKSNKPPMDKAKNTEDSRPDESN